MRQHPSFKKIEKAILVGLITSAQPQDRAEEYLHELAVLAETAGASCEKMFFQRLDKLRHERQSIAYRQLKGIQEID